ncbi:hypothetical protein AAOE16_18070 [Ekhidna sp. MALMAid0563]|uniref:hypothetical protein n=1 Tax=Ekhidna sp. MALMAid0563 TaxID=3143937 RepID=UPI0032DF8DFD
MIEKFIEWYTEGNTLINPYIGDFLSDIEYLGVFAALGIFAVLFRFAAGAVNEKLGVTNEYVASIILLFLVAGILRFTLDGYAYVIKQVEKSTRITLKQQNEMNDYMVNRYTNDLEMQYDSIQNDASASAASRAYAWARKSYLQYNAASKLSSNSSNMASSPFDFTQIMPNILREIASMIRAGLKMFYVGMMNIYYLIIPIALVFSVFKPAHVLQSIGKYAMYGMVIIVINFIEWIMYTMFYASSVNGNTLIDISFIGATLYDALAIFLYLKAFSITRDIIPNNTQEQMGGVIAQSAMMATTFGAQMFAGKGMKAAGAAAKAAGGSNAGGPIESVTN